MVVESFATFLGESWAYVRFGKGLLPPEGAIFKTCKQTVLCPSA